MARTPTPYHGNPPRPAADPAGSLKSKVKGYGRRPKRSLGQVFLIEASIRQKIIDSASLAPEDIVVEIGPGTGALTLELARRARRLYALEIDKDLIGYLRTSANLPPNVRLVCIDALRFDFQRLQRVAGQRLKIVGNLPYSISTPLLFHFVEQRKALELLVLMLQKEVAQRLTAAPRTKAYGVLTVMTRAFMDVSLERLVRRQCFYPVPKVDSALVRVVPRQTPMVPEAHREVFSSVVEAAFSTRRKTLFNALRSSGRFDLPADRLADLLATLQIDPARRAETLELEEFVLLAKGIQAAREQDIDKRSGFVP